MYWISKALSVVYSEWLVMVRFPGDEIVQTTLASYTSMQKFHSLLPFFLLFLDKHFLNLPQSP